MGSFLGFYLFFARADSLLIEDIRGSTYTYSSGWNVDGIMLIRMPALVMGRVWWDYGDKNAYDNYVSSSLDDYLYVELHVYIFRCSFIELVVLRERIQRT